MMVSENFSEEEMILAFSSFFMRNSYLSHLVSCYAHSSYGETIGQWRGEGEHRDVFISLFVHGSASIGGRVVSIGTTGLRHIFRLGRTVQETEISAANWLSYGLKPTCLQEYLKNKLYPLLTDSASARLVLVHDAIGVVSGRKTIDSFCQVNYRYFSKESNW